MQPRYADAWVTDDGRGLRRAGATTILAGLLLALGGLTTLTLAQVTWSGYAAQAVAALGVGLCTMAAGWHLLRRGDRLGPRFHPIVAPSRFGTPTAASTTPIRVRVRTVPLGALPRG